MSSKKAEEANEYTKIHLFELRRNKLIIDGSLQLYTQFKQLKLKPKKNSGPTGIQIHDLCDTGAVLYQLSYQAI